MALQGCSVIVPTFNRARYIGEALRSVLAQTVAPREIIVVDDGSTDETATLVSDFASRHAPHLTLVHKHNGGKSSALNVALPLVTGAFVWIVDDDDVMLPDALERHLAVMTARPDIGFTYSSVLAGTNAPDNSIMRGAEIEIDHIAEEEIFVRLLEECFVVGQPAILARTEAYREIGAFDETLIRSQDYDMLLRLGRRFGAARVAGATMIQRHHEGMRGTAGRSFSARERLNEWTQYDQQIFSKLHRELGLNEYLPGHPSGAVLEDPARRRRAHLQRAVVFVRKGLWDLAFADLEAAIVLVRSTGGILAPAEREMCTRALNGSRGSAELLAQSDLTRTLARVLRAPGGEALAAPLAQGLARCIEWHVHQRRLRDAAELLALLWKISGWREWRHLLNRRLTSSAPFTP